MASADESRTADEPPRAAPLPPADQPPSGETPVETPVETPPGPSWADRIKGWPPKRLALVAALGAAVVAPVLLLLQPSPNAAFSISADSGVVTVQPLCGERLVWDLPVGRVTRRSELPREPVDGAASAAEDAWAGPVTLVLLEGASARVVSTAPGALGIAVSHVRDFHAACLEARSRDGGGSDAEAAVADRPYYEVTAGASAVPHDAEGIGYGAFVNEPAAPVRSPAALVVSGRVVIGDSVSLGAGWSGASSAILESATVDLRVIPWFEKTRITLRTEHLEAGSLFDTHACLAPPERGTTCPAADAPAARGFMRARADGGLSVQLFAHEVVGAQSLGGEQYVMEVPQSTAAWHSTTVTTLSAVLVAAFAIYTGIRMLIRDSIAMWRNTPLPVVACLVLAAPAAWAEPVEIRQGPLVGAGYSFRRAGACYVVTARHVVPEMGVPVTVIDRTGAQSGASRSYDNQFYDLALLALPDKAPVACSAAWPDVAWLARASFSSRNEFRAVRHYTNGRETIVRLQHAGGIKHLLTLAPVDKLTIRESDSGAIVELDGRPVGIVQSVDTATDRVNVLRFDTIDQLIGDRFRATTTGPVSYVGVLSRGRVNELWSTYVHAWITEKAGRAVLPPATGAGRGGAPSVCELKVDVLAWERVSVPNPDYGAVELQLKACGRRGFIFEQTCAAGRRAAANTPRQILSHKLTLNSTVTPPGGAPVSKLETTTHVPPSARGLGRTEIDLFVLQAAAGPALQELMTRAPCP